MNKQEILDIMNSDFKLWESSETEELGDGKVVKTIDLPWGIGQTSLTLEGITNAQSRREAVNVYGGYIRSVIDEQINDEAVTARAKAAAARAEPADSGDSDSSSPRVYTSPAPAVDEEAAGVFETNATGPADLGEDLAARRTALVERINAGQRDVRRWSRELKGIEAALAAMEEYDD